MTNIQAAVGCAQLERVDEFVEKKKYIREYYSKHLSGISDISFFPEVEWAESACWFSGLVLSDKYEVKKVCELLKEKGIEARTFWKPVHQQKPYVNEERSEMKVADNLWKHVLTLPSSTGITEEELEQVVKAIKEIF